MKLDLIQTLALAGVVLFIGYGFRRLLPWLTRFNIPAPVIGGLLAAVAVLLARACDFPVPEYDTALQRPLLVAVTTGGFLGFMLGTTANAMPVMRTLVERLARRLAHS